YDDQPLDLLAAQQLARLSLADAFPDGDQVVLGHQRLRGRLVAGLEAHVAVGQDADQLARTRLDHREAGDPLARLDLADLAQRGVGVDGQRIDDHAAFVALHLADLVGLLVHREVAVQDAHAARLGHGDGQTAFGDRVHRRRHDGNVQLDLAGQPCGRIHLGRHDVRSARCEQNIVEGKPFANLHETLRFAGAVSPAPAGKSTPSKAPKRRRGADMAGFGCVCGMPNAHMGPQAYISQMDVTGFAVFDTEVGACGLAWGPGGLAAVRLPYPSADEMRRRLAARFPAAAESEPPPEFAQVIEDVRALLRGEARTFEDVRYDFSEVSAFNRRVYAVALTIPPGETLTYGEVAARLGEPGAARAVGRALGENPFPIVIPCHRVLGAGGRRGGFSAPGGVESKMRMLQIEGALRPETLPLFR